MTNGPGGQGPAPDPQPNSDNPDENQAQQPDPSQPAAEPPIEEDVAASGEPVVALRPPGRHKEGFRNLALVIIAALIVFFTVATLGTALYAEAHLSNDTITTFASDLAKTAIPTLIALLGTAAAWAFKEDKD